ncbi:MAG: tetratricopeptide repeat protein, partial [Pseudomonadota bacterium]|nr:tetratricopeptide repeat protein [Pseudomonadota bacterium]
DEAQQIAAQMQIQSIPAVYAFFQGRPVDGFMGAVPESQVRQFVDQLAAAADKAAGPSPIDEALDQAKAALESGDASAAGAIYGQILQQDQVNVKAMAGMGRCYPATGQAEAAQGILDSIPEDQNNDPDVTAFRTALELAAQVNTSSGETAALEEKVAANPQDHQVRFDLALAYYGDGANEQAIDALLDILRSNLVWNEGAAREQLVKIFEALGDAHPDTVEGRQKMASVLFA